MARSLVYVLLDLLLRRLFPGIAVHGLLQAPLLAAPSSEPPFGAEASAAAAAEPGGGGGAGGGSSGSSAGGGGGGMGGLRLLLPSQASVERAASGLAAAAQSVVASGAQGLSSLSERMHLEAGLNLLLLRDPRTALGGGAEVQTPPLGGVGGALAHSPKLLGHARAQR